MDSQTLLNQLLDYLNNRLSLEELVKWAESSLIEPNIPEYEDVDVIMDILTYLGAADSKGFPLTWEIISDFVKRLESRTHVFVERSINTNLLGLLPDGLHLLLNLVAKHASIQSDEELNKHIQEAISITKQIESGLEQLQKNYASLFRQMAEFLETRNTPENLYKDRQLNYFRYMKFRDAGATPEMVDKVAKAEGIYFHDRVSLLMNLYNLDIKPAQAIVRSNEE